MTVITPPSYMQNRTDHTAQTDRLAESGILLPAGAGNTWQSGVRGNTDMKVTAQGSPNMTVAVAAGQCFVPCSTALNGTYHVVNDASLNVTITAAHASLNRIDLIVCRVDDAFFSGATDAASIVVVTGTAAASPVAPTVTGSYVLLATILVAAAVTSITNAAITDGRAWASALGGVLYCLNTAARNALTDVRKGQVVFNDQTHNLEFWDGAVWKTIQITTPAAPTWTNISSFTSGYTTNGFGYTAACTKMPDGEIKVRGGIAKTTGNFPTGGTALATLPGGFFPGATVEAACCVSSSASKNTARIEISSGGVIQSILDAGQSDKAWISLDGIAFYPS